MNRGRTKGKKGCTVHWKILEISRSSTFCKYFLKCSGGLEEGFMMILSFKLKQTVSK